MNVSEFPAADAKRLKENMRSAYFQRVWDASQQADFFGSPTGAPVKKSHTWPCMHCLPRLNQQYLRKLLLKLFHKFQIMT